MADTSKIELRGRDLLTEILGKLTFSEAFYLAVTGRQPTSSQVRVVDAALVVLMDHGLTPTALVARVVGDSLPSQPQVAIASGLLMIGEKFVGTMVGAAEYLSAGDDAVSDELYAKELVDGAAREGRRLPGFGHPYYFPEDPRTQALSAIASDAGVAGEHVARLKVIHETLETRLGKQITCNVTAMLGALLLDIDFPIVAMRGLAVTSRAAGLTAHVAEEATTPGITAHLMDVAGRINYDGGMFDS